MFKSAWVVLGVVRWLLRLICQQLCVYTLVLCLFMLAVASQHALSNPQQTHDTFHLSPLFHTRPPPPQKNPTHPLTPTHSHSPGIEQLAEEDVFLLDDSPRPQLSRPGCYRGVCVALKLHHLAVAAVDTAPQLAELSGALTLEGLLGPAAAAFKVLRELVQVRGGLDKLWWLGSAVCLVGCGGG